MTEIFAPLFPTQLVVCLGVILFKKMDLYMQVEIGMRNLVHIMEPSVILVNIHLLNWEILKIVNFRKSFVI